MKSVNFKEYKEMKIAIPVEEHYENVCPVLGRTPFFLFLDLDTNQRQIVENPATEAQSGAGIKVAQFLLDSKVNVLITARCGENSAEILQEAKIQIFKSEGNGVEENLSAYMDNKLSILEKFHGGYHGIQ